jgi:hypothetical protein
MKRRRIIDDFAFLLEPVIAILIVIGVMLIAP